ncbi:hypothetical protein [Micromonospora sp. NPDC005806]|uniref:hypothetical protein n=1 Tax=Micromonospora sp. NPDC005806 TaxID=3364234 RepID=UPI0036A90A2C
MRNVVRSTVVSGLVLAVVAVSGPAQATHEYDGMMPTANYDVICLSASGPADGEVCRTDNADVYWYADSANPGELEADDFNALRTMLLNEYVPTDLALTYDSSPVFSGDAETDLVYQEAEADLPLPSGILGATWCNGAAPAYYECDQTYIRIVSPDGFRRYGGSIACHETGHGVGLVHGNDASPRLDPGDARLGCMVNEDQFPSDLGSDSTHLINVTY